MNFAHCRHTALAIEKYTDVFRGGFFGGGREGVTREEMAIFYEGGAGLPSTILKNNQNYQKL